MNAPRPLLHFLLLLLLFPAVSTLFAALQAGFSTLAWWQWGLIALLPGLIWLWLRHFTIIGCSTACRPQDPSPARHPSARGNPDDAA